MMQPMSDFGGPKDNRRRRRHGGGHRGSVVEGRFCVPPEIAEAATAKLPADMQGGQRSVLSEGGAERGGLASTLNGRGDAGRLRLL